DILHAVALADHPQPFKEGLGGHVNELLRFGADGTTGKGLSTVSMKSLIVRAHVHRHDVPFLQDSSVGNAVDHHIVDADARACREAAVIQERRFGALTYNEI